MPVTIDRATLTRLHAAEEARFVELHPGSGALAEAAALLHVSTTEAWFRSVLEADPGPSAVPRDVRSTA